MMNDDMDLVNEYARSGSEYSFATLVSRYVDLVYSVAMRQVHDTHQAEEITQAVFIILARKAGSLNAKTILSAWLCRTAQYAAADALKIQRRRQRREQKLYMESTLNQIESDSRNWTEIAPALDTAMAKLGEKDHCAIVLRFFEGKDLKQIGAALGVSENAAKARVSRATDKLRKFFLRRGITLSAAAISAAISANSIQAAPIGLAASVTVATVKGTAVTVSTLTIIKTTLKIMTWTKLKTVAGVGVLALLVTGTTTLVIHTVNAQTNRADAPANSSPFAFAGYATPEAAIQSLLWAFSTGDVENLKAGFTENEMEKFHRMNIAGKSDDEVKQFLKARANVIAGYKITQTEVISDSEVHLHVHFRPSAELRRENTIIIMNKTGKEWKNGGEMH